jgi:hypothetical protein
LRRHKPKSLCGKELSNLQGKAVDESDPPRVAVDRSDYVSDDPVKCLTLKRVEEIADCQIVGHIEMRCVGHDDLHAPASVLVPSPRKRRPSDLGQHGRDLDANHSAERPSRRLMDDSPFTASEVHERVFIRHSKVGKRRGYQTPRRGHIGNPVGMGVFGLDSNPTSVEAPI